MKKLLKSGVTSTLGLLLCTSVANAEGLNNTRKYKPYPVEIPTETKSELFVSKSTIQFLESKLRLAADSQTTFEQPKDFIISNRENSIGNFFPADTPLVALINTRKETFSSLNRF